MKKIVLPDRGAEILFDVRDENVRLLEALFGVEISARGSQLRIDGEKKQIQVLEKILADFSSLVSKGVPFSNGDLQQAFRQLAQEEGMSLADFFPKQHVLETPRRRIVPKTPNQIRYIQAIEDNDLVLAIGPAGTGKTYLAVAMAILFLSKKLFQRIVLARPAVEAGERLGFLPGDLQEKVDPYLRPLYDALFEMLGGEKVQRLIDRGVIEIAPLAFMRGRTFNDCFIILDEAQNCRPEQMKMFLTRLGSNSKAVVTGDITQVDLPADQRSGLVQAREILSGVEGISTCFFQEKDVSRHRLVKQIIQAYDKLKDEESDAHRG